jgi:hypothetical protein
MSHDTRALLVADHSYALVLPRDALDGLDVGVAADTRAHALAELRAAGVEVGR